MKFKIVYITFPCLILIAGLLACAEIWLLPFIYWCIFSGSLLFIITGMIKRHFSNRVLKKAFYANLIACILFLVITLVGKLIFDDTNISFEDNQLIIQKRDNNLLLLSCGSDFYIYKKTFYGYRAFKLISNKDCIVKLEKIKYNTRTSSYKIYVNNPYKIGYYEFFLRTGRTRSKLHKPGT